MSRKPGESTWKSRSGTWLRRCSGCGKVKPLDSFPQYGGRFYYRCKPCYLAKQRVKDTANRPKPEYKEKARRTKKAWRERYPEKNAERNRKYRENVKADPKRHAMKLEGERMRKRLKREREGRPMVRFQREVTNLHVDDFEIPSAPLYVVLRRHVEHAADEARSAREVCENIGITERMYRRWATGEAQVTRYATADKVLTALGLHWWDVWDESEVPERIAA